MQSLNSVRVDSTPSAFCVLSGRCCGYKPALALDASECSELLFVYSLIRIYGRETGEVVRELSNARAPAFRPHRLLPPLF